MPGYQNLCKAYTGYHGTSEIEHSLSTCTVDNPLAKVSGISLRIGGQIIPYLSPFLFVKEKEFPEDLRECLFGKDVTLEKAMIALDKNNDGEVYILD